MKKNFSDYIVALGVLLCSLVLLAALTIALAERDDVVGEVLFHVL